MKVESEGQLLRIYISESDRLEGRPLYEAIVRAAREQGLAGATALRGIEGFGASGQIHTVRVLHLSEALPVVVEIADRAERIAAFMPTVDEMVREGMVTIEPVNIVVYRREVDETPSTDDELQLESQEEGPQLPADVASRFIPLTDGGRQIIEVARKAAAGSRRVFVDSVDMMLAMLRERDGIAGRVLTNMRIDLRAVARSLNDEVSRDEPTANYLTALDAKSLAEAKWLEHDHIGTEHLLLAVCEIRPSAATDILMRLGAQPRDICKEVLEILGHEDDWQRWLADHPDM
jgi:PII-like signaling protein